MNSVQVVRCEVFGDKKEMAEKKERREAVSIEIDGKTYTGHVIIMGTRKLTFCVEYQGKRSANDSRSWKPGVEEHHNILVIAEIHLDRLVREVERL